MARVGAGRAVCFGATGGRRACGPVERGASIDELLDRAVAAINRGDRVTATALAGQVLAVDQKNADAEDLLGAPGDAGEIRRLTILFADLSIRRCCPPGGARDLSDAGRSLPQQVLAIVNRYEGHIGSTKVMGCWRCSAIRGP